MERNPGAYEDSLIRYLKAKNSFKLCHDDKEPDHRTFGLSDWEGEKLKERVIRELNRTV